MTPAGRREVQRLQGALERHHTKVRPLPGVAKATRRAAFVGQLVESIRRVKYFSVIAGLKLSASRADPRTDLFDPIRAAAYAKQHGDLDEAFWFVFLAVFFGKPRAGGWRLVRDVYGGLGGPVWTWARLSGNPGAFRDWLATNEAKLRSDGVARRLPNAGR